MSAELTGSERTVEFPVSASLYCRSNDNLAPPAAARAGATGSIGQHLPLSQVGGSSGLVHLSVDEVAVSASFPIRDSLLHPKSNALVVHLSSFHGGHRLDRPMGLVAIGPYPLPTAIGPFAATLIATGALMAAAFGFGVIHSIRKTESSLALAGMAGVAALQATIENVRAFTAYPYPLHVWRLWSIWALAATFAILLVDYIAARFWPRARREVVGTAVVLVAASLVAPGFDEETGWALAGGVAVATLVAALGVRRRKPGAFAAVAYLMGFLFVAIAYPEWLVDLSYFVLAACLGIPLLYGFNELR